MKNVWYDSVPSTFHVLCSSSTYYFVVNLHQSLLFSVRPNASVKRQPPSRHVRKRHDDFGRLSWTDLQISRRSKCECTCWQSSCFQWFLTTRLTWENMSETGGHGLYKVRCHESRLTMSCADWSVGRISTCVFNSSLCWSCNSPGNCLTLTCQRKLLNEVDWFSG